MMKTMQPSNVTVRLSSEELADVDALIPVLEKQAQGAHISRATALRAIIAKGVAAIRTELGIHAKKH